VELTYHPRKKQKTDLEIFLLIQKQTIEKTLKKYLRKHTNIKFDVSTQVILGRLEVGQNHEEIIHTKPWFNSNVQTVFNSNEVERKLKLANEKLLDSYDNFMRMGSGWFLIKVLQMKLKVYHYKPLRGGCFASKLPAPYDKMRGILTFPQTGDRKCFLYCVLAGLFPQKEKKNDFLQYQKFEDKLITKSLNYPVQIDGISEFEQDNNLSINIYILRKKQKHHVGKCIRISDNTKAVKHLNLLLYKRHYHLITNISTFLRYVDRHRRWQCKKCLQFKKSKIVKCETCFQTTLVFPDRNQKQRFTNVQNITRSPFVLYCDLETMALSEGLLEENSSKTKKESKHQAIAFGLYCVCSEESFSDKSPTIYVGTDAIEVLFGELERKLNCIHSIQKEVNFPIRMTKEDNKRHKRAEKCYLCERKFDDPSEKFRDHNHLKESNNFLGAVCNICNLHCSSFKSKVPLFFHNGGKFDMHFLIEKFDKLTKLNDIMVLPKSGESFNAITLFNRNLQIRDSYNHLGNSLAELVRINKESGRTFFHSEKTFGGKNIDLLLRKGVFPYAYITSEEKLKETSLPEAREFFDPLSEKSITEENYQHARKVWNSFSCKTIEDYLKIYLTSDITLLSDVFEAYREFFKSKFDLDPAYYVSLPSLSYDCALKYTGSSIDFMYDEETYLFIKDAIRGGVASISRRYAEANNPYIPQTFDKERSNSFIMYFDCNSLYSSIMSMKLPYKNLRFIDAEDFPRKTIFEYKNEDEIGYFIQCDLFYPKEIHDQTKDLPFAPRHFSIEKQHLSPYNQRLTEEIQIPNFTGKKLIADQFDKMKYITHIANLKFYLEHGMQLGKIHKVLRFKQKAVFKPYIELCVEERAKTSSLAEKNLWKLACNSLFGKSITNLEKQSKTSFVSEEKRLLNNIKSPYFKSANIINSKLVQVNKNFRKKLINSPYPIGVTILELSKLTLYQWHYDFFIKKFGASNVELCMTDTDSLLYLIHSEDVYKDLLNEANFDFSNYPKEHPLYNEKNKGKLFHMKDEIGGKPIKSFLGLRAKSYSIEFGDKSKKVTGKGIAKSKLLNITHEEMKETLFKEKTKYVKSKHIRSFKHKLYNIEQEKLALSPFDNKRYVLDGGVYTLPIGHYKTTS